MQLIVYLSIPLMLPSLQYAVSNHLVIILVGNFVKVHNLCGSRVRSLICLLITRDANVTWHPTELNITFVFGCTDYFTLQV
uniref:Putative secreted protein n=1 Tax=Ixodes ricinus TaxID=34613 RepID=A0A6B0TW48_IXORI